MRALLVTLVQPVQLGDDDPGREGQHEQPGLRRSVNGIAVRRVRSEEELRDREGHCQSYDVGARQGSPNQPTSPTHEALPTPMLEDLERPVTYRRPQFSELGQLGSGHRLPFP